MALCHTAGLYLYQSLYHTGWVNDHGVPGDSGGSDAIKDFGYHHVCQPCMARTDVWCGGFDWGKTVIRIEKKMVIHLFLFG